MSTDTVVVLGQVLTAVGLILTIAGAVRLYVVMQKNAERNRQFYEQQQRSYEEAMRVYEEAMRDRARHE